MGKFKYIPQPQVAPAKCIGCFKGGRPVVDYGMDIDGYGAVYFCTDCIIESAELVGLVSPRKYANLGKKKEDLEEYTRRANGIIERAYIDLGDLNKSLRVVIPDDSLNVPIEPVELAIIESGTTIPELNLDKPTTK